MQSGKNTVLLVQLATAALGEDGFLIGNLTENSHSMENEVVDEQTKFGRIVAYGQSSESFELTAYGDKNDTGQKAILEAIRNEVQLKVWEVDLETVKNASDEEVHDAIFAYTIVESVERSNPGDNFQEISATLQVIGKSQTGQLPKLPDEVIEFATYGFEEPGEKSGEFGKDPASVAVTGVTLSPSVVSIVEGDTLALTPNITPANATNKAVTYATGATGVATVSATGVVTAVSAGTATITVTTVDGSKTATTEVTVTV